MASDIFGTVLMGLLLSLDDRWLRLQTAPSDPLWAGLIIAGAISSVPAQTNPASGAFRQEPRCGVAAPYRCVPVAFPASQFAGSASPFLDSNPHVPFAKPRSGAGRTRGSHSFPLDPVRG